MNRGAVSAEKAGSFPENTHFPDFRPSFPVIPGLVLLSRLYRPLAAKASFTNFPAFLLLILQINPI
jgi:hypothetical protein